MRITALFRAWLVLAALPSALLAQFTITGVADRATPLDSVTFTINTQAGYDYNATLNWKPIAVGTPVVVNRPDFYELRVDATNQTTSAVTSQYRRFIVSSSERNVPENSELGIPPHVPFPVIQSCSNEFVGARLRLLVPASFPAGYPVPLVAWVIDDQDRAVRANGLLKNSGATLFQIKRGVGSGFITPPDNSSSLNLELDLSGIGTNVSVTVETNVPWTPVSGILSGAVTWTNHSRIQITAGAIIPAGSSLTIGAGTIVRVNNGVTITNNGTVTINGTTEEPVVFMSAASGQPWGGFVQHAANTAFTATGAIFTGSGKEPCWYSNAERGCNSGLSGLGSHRTEQPLVALNGANCNLTLTDCAAISLAGQLSHAQSGGSYTIRLTRFLLQRATSGGEFTSASLTVNDSALIDCPDDSVVFENEDHDALYIVNGSHFFTNTLFGWTKDDGVDSGGSGTGPLTYQSCWFEATFHEGNSLSGFKNVFTRDTVYFDCGQGIEGGYDAPTSRVDHCLFSMCESGIRHGDNYETFSMYEGPMTATNNISIYNHRDLFGFNWDNSNSGGWTNNYVRFGASNNFVSALDTNYPNNTLWNPVTDAWRLGAFGGVGRVGVGFGVRSSTLTSFGDGMPVGLSRFCTNEVQVGYVVDSTGGTHLSGTLVFPAGLTRQFIPVPTNLVGVVRIALTNPQNADVTGPPVFVQNLPLPAGAAPTVLSPYGAIWRYLDDGSEQGTAWRAPGFNDTTWGSGPSRLGFGPDAAPLGTTIRKFVQTNGVDTTRQITNFYFRRAIVVTNPASFSTIQFRYQKDDGCVVYLNGNQIFTNNMGPPPYSATNFAASTVSGIPALMTFWTNSLAASNFLAGTNLIAVEVHQSTSTSSDIAWHMELVGIPPSTNNAPSLNLWHFGTDAVIYWNDSTFPLEEADIVTGPWRRANPTNSPSASSIIGNRFFRLKR